MGNVVIYEGREVTFHDIDPEDHIEGFMSRGCWYELPNLEYIRDLKVKGNYVDVGAYVGTHSLYFALFCEADHVYAFEPQLKAYEKLVKNLRFNADGKITANHVALGAHHDTGNMLSLYPENRGGTFLKPGTDVVVETLDSFNLDGVKLLKIDVEGMAHEVLLGSLETLTGVEHIFVELWPKESCEHHGIEYTADSTRDLLDNLWFEPVKELPLENLWHFAR